MNKTLPQQYNWPVTRTAKLTLEQYIKLICRPAYKQEGTSQLTTKREVAETMQDRLMPPNYAISGNL